MTHKQESQEIKRGTTPYGYRRGTGGTLIPLPSEQAMLAYIAELRGEGHSLALIAQHLNDEGISTKRGRRWYASTVAYLIKEIVPRHSPHRAER